jgi:hypothetical protein
VVDELPDAPAPADDPAPPAPLEVPKAPARLAWSGKPDPAANPIDYSNIVGAPTWEQRVLLASMGGPYFVGVPVSQELGKRTKNVKTNDQFKPLKTVSVAGDPFPVMDFRNGKEVGAFQGACNLHYYWQSRLSPDGQYLAWWQTDTDQTPRGKLGIDYLVVWKRGEDKPVLRWPTPAHVPWIDFVGPDRLALYHTGPTPRFVVLDIGKGAPVVTAALPEADFPPTTDDKTPADPTPFYHPRFQSHGAVSPGGAYVALTGKAAIVVVATADGHLAGRLITGPVEDARGYLGLAFDEGGTEFRTIYKSGTWPILRVWSMADGQVHHTGPYQAEWRVGGILNGPDPGTLIVGNNVIDVESGKPIFLLKDSVERWAGPDRILTNYHYHLGKEKVKAIEDAVEYQVMGGVFAISFARAEYKAQATAFAAAKQKAPPTRPQAMPPDRSGVVAIKPRPEGPWAVKPSPAPALPADFSAPVWPDAFAATEAAVLPDGHTWVRNDLKTGQPLGEPVKLWPDNMSGAGAAPPVPARRGPRGTALPPAPANQGRHVALSQDGRRLAVVDPADPARFDVWDASGKRLFGLRPYSEDAIAWLGWSASGQVLTACADVATGWDGVTGKAVFEIEGAYKSWSLAPGCAWLVAATPAGNLDFFDGSTGKPLGRIPGLVAGQPFSVSPDGKTLIRPGAGGTGLQVWDLATGQRTTAPEMPVGGVLGPWVAPRCTLTHAQAFADIPARYLLYDLDVHTHTCWYDASTPIDVRNDPFGRAWMTRPGPARGGPHDPPPSWGPVRGLAKDGFDGEMVFARGTTIRVEVDVGHRDYGPKIARNMAESLRKSGLKIGRGGWVLRADHTVGTGKQKFSNTLTGKEGTSVVALDVTWRLIAPDGSEVWQRRDGSSFNPFASKYVKVGSRRGTFNPGGGGYQQVELDFDGKDPGAAQMEEILEQMLLYRSELPYGLPVFVARGANGYAPLPIKVEKDGAGKP